MRKNICRNCVQSYILPKRERYFSAVGKGRRMHVRCGVFPCAVENLCGKVWYKVGYPAVFQTGFPQAVENDRAKKGDILCENGVFPGFRGIYTPRTRVFHGFPHPCLKVLGMGNSFPQGLWVSCFFGRRLLFGLGFWSLDSGMYIRRRSGVSLRAAFLQRVFIPEDVRGCPCGRLAYSGFIFPKTFGGCPVRAAPKGRGRGRHRISSASPTPPPYPFWTSQPSPSYLGWTRFALKYLGVDRDIVLLKAGLA